MRVPPPPPSPITEQEPLCHVDVVKVQHNERDGIVPWKAMQQPPGDGTNHAAHDKDRPHPAQDAHVAVFVALVSFRVARGCPQQFNTKEPILDSR